MHKMEGNMKKGLTKNGFFWVMLFITFLGIVFWVNDGTQAPGTTDISSTEFVTYLEDNRVESFSIRPKNNIYEIEGTLRQGAEIKTENNAPLAIFGQSEQKASHFTSAIVRNDAVVDDVFELAKKHNVKNETMEEPTSGLWTSVILTFLPIIILVGFFYFIMGRGQGGAGGRGVMNFGKSRAKKNDPEKSKVRFSDVAGADEEKAELVEIVEFLKDPRRFSELGARIPAGVLLEGPPGTGKTLLAKAVAGEAKVPFYSISGSEFVEMFVGVGASRVRDLFENAKKNAPAIIFIDEIDAVGRQRGAGMGGGHDEREQTLNQLLVEMDGFAGNEGIIVMAATNRQDILDPALLRPGRFDRRILVGRPDVKGREAILRIHANNKPISKVIDLALIAKQTPGFSGADLENLLNEAALVAARRRSKVIESQDLDEAHDRVIAGPAKKDRVISERERKMVAYHEAGHTICGLVLSDARTVHKVTIVPRGRAGGYAIMLPKEDRFLMTKKELFDQLVGLLGGRVAEEIVFDSQSSGASNDFQQATQIARAMVTQYGMSDILGPVQYEGDSKVFMGRDLGQNPAYSQDYAYKIDQEVLRILNEAHAKAREIIEEYADTHTLIAEKLLEVETLDANEIKNLFETGEMPKDTETQDMYPSEKDSSSDDQTIGTSYEDIVANQKELEQRKNSNDRFTDDDAVDELEEMDSDNYSE